MTSKDGELSRFRRLALAIGVTALATVSLCALLFLVAGRWNLPWFQAYVIVYTLFCFGGMLLLDPGLIRERIRPGRGGRDKFTVGAAKLLSSLQFVVAAMDVGRFGWTGRVPIGLHLAGLVLAALCAVGLIWTMRVNRFFSGVVRIQDDRDHHLITDGPYRVVRHPGYIFVVVLLLATSAALGSLWSLVPAAAAIALLWRRTVLEDRFLRESLVGYEAYARAVRFRWIRGVW